MDRQGGFNIETYYQDLSNTDYQFLGPRADSLARFSQYETPFELTLKYLDGGSRVLDWGCGNGFFSHFLIRHKFSVVGYGFDECLLDDDAFTYIKGDETEPVKLPFDDEAFDCVFSIGVLEHVHQIRTKPEGGDQLKSAKEIFRILKPGGIFLIVNLPNKYSWTLLKKSSRIKHDKRFGNKEIRALMDEGGFVIEQMGRYGGLPRNATSRFPFFKIKMISKFYNGLNKVMERLFPIISTNWFVVARKPE